MVAQPFCFQDAIGPQLRHECVSYLLPLVNARQVQGHALGNDRSLSNSVKQPGSCRLIESVGQLDVFVELEILIIQQRCQCVLK